ncbi:hypothetical protein SAMN05880593_10651 [Rhizobium sp. RU36D]|nr:hypothetical protein SAMN05880593_10651 [Rhizobium sp. RU36D]
MSTDFLSCAFWGVEGRTVAPPCTYVDVQDLNISSHMYFVGSAVVNFISSIAIDELKSENSTRLIRFL